MVPPRPIARPDELALLLDFDGTLVEIADRPDAISVPPGLHRTLAELHTRLGGALALVSGRSVADIRRYLPDFPGTIVGSHGSEVAKPGAEPAPLARIDGLDDIRNAVGEFAAGHPDLLFEDKTHSVVLHFRAAPELGAEVERFMKGVGDRYPDFALQQAKMAWELRPAFADKGSAVAALMQDPPFSGRVPIYAGDDTTDEAAMQTAADLGGAGIKIGPGDSVARYRLADTAALLEWLEGAV